jgi:tetratricopeptide (TPR) repeat protein
MWHKKTAIIILLIVGALNASATNNLPKFEEGAKLYTEGKYAEAEEIWMSLFNEGYKSADLFYNIGNACFKQNKLSGAIIFYERALLLRPAGEDISYNIQITRTLLKDKFKEVPRPFFAEWFDFVSLALSTNFWALAGLIIFVAFLSCSAVFLMSSSLKARMTAFWLSIIFLLVTVLSIAFSLRSRKLIYDNDYAIVLSEPVAGKSAPGEGGAELFILHEGTKVKTGDTVGDFTEVRLPDGNKGWIITSGIRKI